MAFYKLGTREGGVNPTGNAVEANVLKNKTFSNASGINKIGTMPDNSTTTSNGTVPGINSSYPNIPIRPGSNLQMGVNTDGVKQLAIEPPQGYYPGGGSSYIGVDADDLGDAVASDVVSGKTFTSKSGIEVVGTRENSGTYTASSRNAALDMGNPNTYRYVNTTGVPNSNTETYTASSRSASLDMGATNSYRYVNTNGVPNSNSGTYTFASGDTGGTKDLGVTNTYRYVNATNVYNKGKADGASTNNNFILRAAALGTTAYGGIILNYNYLKQFTKVKPVMLYGSGNVIFQKCNDYPADNSYTRLATFNNNQDNYLPTLSTNTFYLLQFASQKGICELTFS